jgi:oligopeptide transport system substrate-binding protein
LLQLAAVAGRRLDLGVLRALAPEVDLSRWLTVCADVAVLEVGDEGWRFAHHKLRAGVLDALPNDTRPRLHRQVAETLERSFPERVEEQVGLLAHHWERAEDPEKAIGYLSRAGDQARLAYAHQEAIDYYERALTFLKERGEHERAARTLMKLGLTYHTAFDFRSARQAYEEGFALWQRAGQTRVDAVLPPAPHALRIRWLEPPTLDPTKAGDIFSIALIDQLFCRLVDSGSEMNIVPGVAQSWEVSEAGQKYVFRLRDDVYWSDSTPVTAGDFEFACKRVLDPAAKLPYANKLYVIKGAGAFHQGEAAWKDVGVCAIDKTTLLVELEGPTGHFLYLLTSMAYPVPRHVVEAHGEAWTEVENLVTNGPFKLQTWKRGETMVLVRNPGYYGRFGGNVQRVELSLLEDQSAALEMYAADDLDVLDIQFLSPAKLERARQRYAGDYVTKPVLSLSYVRFDASRPPFDDVRVRRAFILATDRETQADVIRRGISFPATGGFVPPGMPGHSAGIGLPYDPEQARQLLAEAGYPGGRGFPVLDVLIPPVPTSHKVIEYMQAQWRENLGIEISWQTAEFAVFLDRARKEPPHVLISAEAADYPDPDVFLSVNFLWEESGWRNETYEGLVEQARRTIDQGERMKLYGQADRILVEEAALMPLVYWRSHLLIKPWVTRYPTSAIKDCFWKDVVIEPH